MPGAKCLFCQIAAEEIPAQKVYEDNLTVVFLDHSPLYHGHCLVCPKEHYETLLDVPPDQLQPLFSTVQLVGRAVEDALGSGGSFIAVNVKVSQTVPHLHVHVIPRTRGDGMKGFFWPRRPYNGDDHAAEVARAIGDAMRKLGS